MGIYDTDILLDIEDVGLKYNMKTLSNSSLIDHISQFHLNNYPKSEDSTIKDDLLIKIYKLVTTLRESSTSEYSRQELSFNTSLTKECIERIFHYIKQTGVNIKDIKFQWYHESKTTNSNSFPNDKDVIQLWIYFKIKKKWWDSGTL